MLWKCTKCLSGRQVNAEDFPFYCCDTRYDFPAGIVKLPPSIARRAANFARDGLKHALGGSQLVDDATRDWRRSQCLSCAEYFDAELETCTHPQCGCGMKKQRGIIDALGWASKRCPIGRWKYAPITTRNLIYHVCPLASNDGWRQNVRQLLKRWHVFNGRRIIAIARGEGMEWEQVHSEFQGEDYEFFYVENDPHLREVASFLPLLEQAQNTNHDEATFYAHTKGNSTSGNQTGAIRWRNMMYAELLDDPLNWQRCMIYLTDFAAVGCNKMVWGNHPISPYPSRLKHGQWMFGGTFWWVRNDVAFAHPKWRAVPVDRYAAEAWLSGLIEYWQAKSVFQKWDELSYPGNNPYDPRHYSAEFDDAPL